MRDAFDQRLFPGFLPVEVCLQHRVIGLGHRLDQPRPQPLRLGHELGRHFLERVAAELSVGLP